MVCSNVFVFFCDVMCSDVLGVCDVMCSDVLGFCGVVCSDV